MDIHRLTLDFHESLSLRKTLRDWLGASVKDETLAELKYYLPYDYTLQQINERSRTKLEYVQYLMTLTVMRRSFFQWGTTMHHAMDLVYEFAVLRLSECIGVDHRCVYRKNSEKQNIEDARQKQYKQSETTRRKRQYNEYRRSAAGAKRARILEEKNRKTQLRERGRIAKCAAKYEHCVKLWSDEQRYTLFKRIERSDPATQLKVLTIVNYYIPGTFESGELDPMEWTTQTCRHISSRVR